MNEYLVNKKFNFCLKIAQELVTPPLNGLILPGVTRSSLLEVARSWGEFEVNEREITMHEIIQAEADGKVSLIIYHIHQILLHVF